METMLKEFCETITQEQQENLRKSNLACEGNLKNAESHYHIKSKYTYINIGTSGRYMIDNKTQDIFGIKAYRQIHRGHYYGKLKDYNQYYWGDYYPSKKN